MALVKCKECGEQVSTTAQSCPKCGAKPPKKTSLGTWLVLGFVILVVYVAVQTPSTNTSSIDNPSPPAITLAPQKPQWKTSSSTDQMNGKRQAYATSPTVGSTKKMSFPYGDVEAWLGVGCDGKHEWAYIGFTKSPNLSHSTTENGYNSIATRIKWNNSIQNVNLTQEWGASFIHFENGRDAISRMTNSQSALLELSWYGQNTVYFSFPLDGAAAAVKSMRSQCTDKKR